METMSVWVDLTYTSISWISGERRREREKGGERRGEREGGREKGGGREGGERRGGEKGEREGGRRRGERERGEGEEKRKTIFIPAWLLTFLPSDHRAMCGYSSDQHTTHFRPDNDGGKRFFD